MIYFSWYWLSVFSFFIYICQVQLDPEKHWKTSYLRVLKNGSYILVFVRSWDPKQYMYYWVATWIWAVLGFSFLAFISLLENHAGKWRKTVYGYFKVSSIAQWYITIYLILRRPFLLVSKVVMKLRLPTILKRQQDYLSIYESWRLSLLFMAK